MRTSIRNLCTIFTLFFGSLTLFNQAQAQAPPCRPGNLGAVLGTNCSIGSMIFNFGNDFSGFFDDPTTFGLIDPASIAFTPVSTGSQVGFAVTLNFNENPNSDPIFVSAHSVRFSYTPQAAPNNEIRSQSVSMDAAIGGSPSFIEVSDHGAIPTHRFPYRHLPPLASQAACPN